MTPARARTLERQADTVHRRLLLNQEGGWKIAKATAANEAELGWIDDELAELEAEVLTARDGLTASERTWFMSTAGGNEQPVSAP